jgi:NADH:ubiquinone oxidoreductase subunit 4 (subunit M)
MLLAGLLLKIGTGGFLRLIFLIKYNFDSFFFFISFFGVILGGVFCFFQRDLKSLSAFSSINHMSFLLVLLLRCGFIRKWGSLLIIISHGFISTLIFFLVGEFYHIRFTRNFYFFGGIIFSNFGFLFLFIFV